MGVYACHNVTVLWRKKIKVIFGDIPGVFSHSPLSTLSPPTSMQVAPLSFIVEQFSYEYISTDFNKNTYTRSLLSESRIWRLIKLKGK